MVDTRNESNALGSRFNAWWALTAFSVVVLTSVVTQKDDGGRTDTEKWAISVASITLALGALACIAHGVARARFVGTPVEGGLAALCLGFWAAGLPSLMDPSHDIAVTSGGEVLNANIYFFAWGAFAASLILVGSFAREVVQVQFPSCSVKRTLWWYCLCATSFIVMASGTRVFKNTTFGFNTDLSCSDNAVSGLDYCKRTKFGLSLGLISALLALLFSLLSHRLPAMLESIGAIVLFIMWCFGVGYITFGDTDKSPATRIGNFYFSTWFSFVLSLLLASDSMAETYRKYVGGDDETSAAAKDPETTEPQVTVESKV